MSKEKSFDNLKKEITKKSEIWSADDNDNKEFMESDVSVKKRLNPKKLNPHQEHHIINQYSIEQDKFKILNKKAKFKLPLWLVATFCALSLLILFAAIGAIFIAIFSNHNYLSFNQKCDDSTRFCDSGKNLKCQNGLCNCTNSDFYWSEINKTCLFKSFYTGPCSITSDCIESIGLYCSRSASGCNCPSPSKAGMCDCPLTKYFDETTKTCVNKLPYGSPCTFDKQCAQDISLVCTSGICSCVSTKFYLGSVCVNKYGVDQLCSGSNVCDDTKLLVCDGVKCSCPTGYYYDNSLRKCNLLKTYDVSCLANQCDASKSLTCSIGGKCACITGFWSTYSNKCLTCPDATWVAFQNTACLFLGNQDTKTNAENFCNSKGAKMCHGQSNVEFDIVQQFLISQSNADNVWMGVSKNTNYFWQDGSIVSSMLWCATTYTNNCARLERKSAIYCLTDKSCNDNNNKICCIKFT